ncbi:hypothetical protein O1W71_14230 [Microbacterium sp. H37-C3]|uniref:hypothetical protein n=1 Tax=Microbacterium sp. H37-C3 TaxID=3004354 RepID=UPI0022AF58CD|nr:hypothetical protein [Microbacterium sp. H37-C3]MCZ4068832.1 hypothetical protein [Microbacterium sp. H37-C3]
MEADDVPNRIPIDREQSRSWVEVAQSARLMRDLLSETPPAIGGSPFRVIDEQLPQSCEKWCRSYLSSALEHLGMWADFVAPLSFHPDTVVHHEARPAQTLARAALESASQAVWVMASRDPREVLRRHLLLVLADWAEQRKAEVHPERKDALKQQRLDLLEILESYGVKVDDPSYLTLVTAAANEVRNHVSDGDLGNPAQVERLWRASAGSAHGKMWPSLELRVSVEVDGRPYSFPDADAMSAILVLADKVTQYGVFRFIDYAGHEPGLAERLRATAMRWYARIPKVPGAPDRLDDLADYPPAATNFETRDHRR